MDDLNDEQFIDSLSLTNRIIYIRRKTTNLLRAWIIVQERILKFDNVRADWLERTLERLQDWDLSKSSISRSSAVSTLKYDVIGLIPDMTKIYKCEKRECNLS